MWSQLRKALITVLGISLGAAGLSAAATGHLNPLSAVSTSEQLDVETASPAPDPTAPASEDGTDEDGGEKGKPEKAGRPSGTDDAEDATEGAGEEGVERITEGCPEGTTNHGQFVSGTETTPRAEAAHSDCGKPVQSVHEDKDKGDHGSDEHGKSGEAHGHDDDGEDGAGTD